MPLVAGARGEERERKDFAAVPHAGVGDTVINRAAELGGVGV